MRKHIFKTALFLFSIVWFSCEDDGPKATLKEDIEPNALEALSATDYVLTMDQAEEVFQEFKWTAPDFGFPAAATYTVEVDRAGNNFATAEELAVTEDLSATLTVGDMNDAMLALGLDPYEKTAVEVRVKTEISPNVDPVPSNIQAFTITPYVSEPSYATIYMVGSATEFDWSETKATPMFRSETNAFMFTFTGYLEQGDLKFLGYLGKWVPMWGTNEAGTVQFRETDSDPDPWSFWVGANGYYTVTLDILAMKYTLTPYDASGAITYSAVNLTGDFNSWGAVPMTNTAQNPHVWSVTYTFDTDTGMKFRNNDWSAQWGPAVNRDKLYGKAVPAGNEDKVAVTAGEYTILFNDLTGHYVLIRKQ
jgi:hypothetical protein